MRLKVSSVKWLPFCLSLNVLKCTWLIWREIDVLAVVLGTSVIWCVMIVYIAGGGGGGFQSTLCLITFPRRYSQDGEVIEWASASNHIRETNVAQNYSPTPKMQINYISNKGSYACLIVTKLLIIIIGLVASKAIFFTSYFHLHFVEKVCCLPRH